MIGLSAKKCARRLSCAHLVEVNDRLWMNASDGETGAITSEDGSE